MHVYIARETLYNSRRVLGISSRRVRWSLVTLPTLWSLVTLPTSLGRVASDYFVVFSWPCSRENKARQISLFVVACDPTYFWGRVASDYFLALPTPPLVAWPYLLSDRLWPYTCLLGRVASDRHWLFVAGAMFSMPPRSSLWPYFLFVWQVQYFRVLRAVLRGPTFFLYGRCNIFDASEKFLRDPGPGVACDPTSFFAWQVQSFRCLREVLRDTAKGCLWP